MPTGVDPPFFEDLLNNDFLRFAFPRVLRLIADLFNDAFFAVCLTLFCFENRESSMLDEVAMVKKSLGTLFMFDTLIMVFRFGDLSKLEMVEVVLRDTFKIFSVYTSPIDQTCHGSE